MDVGTSAAAAANKHIASTLPTCSAMGCDAVAKHMCEACTWPSGPSVWCDTHARVIHACMCARPLQVIPSSGVLPVVPPCCPRHPKYTLDLIDPKAEESDMDRSGSPPKCDAVGCGEVATLSCFHCKLPGGRSVWCARHGEGGHAIVCTEPLEVLRPPSADPDPSRDDGDGDGDAASAAPGGDDDDDGHRFMCGRCAIERGIMRPHSVASAAAEKLKVLRALMLEARSVRTAASAASATAEQRFDVLSGSDDAAFTTAAGNIRSFFTGVRTTTDARERTLLANLAVEHDACVDRVHEAQAGSMRVLGAAGAALSDASSLLAAHASGDVHRVVEAAPSVIAALREAIASRAPPTSCLPAPTVTVKLPTDLIGAIASAGSVESGIPALTAGCAPPSAVRADVTPEGTLRSSWTPPPLPLDLKPACAQFRERDVAADGGDDDSGPPAMHFEAQLLSAEAQVSAAAATAAAASANGSNAMDALAQVVVATPSWDCDLVPIFQSASSIAARCVRAGCTLRVRVAGDGDGISNSWSAPLSVRVPPGGMACSL